MNESFQKNRIAQRRGLFNAGTTRLPASPERRRLRSDTELRRGREEDKRQWDAHCRPGEAGPSEETLKPQRSGSREE